MSASGLATNTLAAWLFRADGTVAIAIFIGMFCGCYTARGRLKLGPIEALRVE